MSCCHASAYTVPFEFSEMPFDEAVRLAADTGVISGDAGPLLETVIDMLDELERPDEHFDVIQVAGTNGKSSTVRFCAAILRGEGLRTALYTSPHLVRYPERMEVDGRVISDAAFAHGVSAAVEAGRRVNARRTKSGKGLYTITPFDLLTVAALVVFAEAGVDVAVLEVGMGGRWDATSATHPVGVAVTGIGLDHTRILGDTLAEIAAEKAAVIQPGRFCVLGEGTHDPEVQPVMDERCRACGIEPFVVTHEIVREPDRLGGSLTLRCPAPRGTYEISIPKPSYQAQNIACAAALAECYLERPLDAVALESSLAACPTPGRFDIARTDPLVLIDACHNPQSCETFISSVAQIVPTRDLRPVLLFATLADKDSQGIARALVPEFPRIIVCQTTSPRALTAEDLVCTVSEELEREGRPASDLMASFDSVADALSFATEEGLPLAVAGTITLAGEVAGLFAR